MTPSYECPVCHRPLFGPDETCGGSFTEADHPASVVAVPAATQPVPGAEGER
jgi:hypothetical protein